MIIGIKDLRKLTALTVVTFCAVFVCSLFLNYNMDISSIRDEIVTQQGMVMYDALVASGKVTVGVSGGCLVITTAVMMIFYIKNYIDSHGKELGILKALGYSEFKVSRHFWIFGLSVFVGAVFGYICAWIYMPGFYRVQNQDGLLPQLLPQFHLIEALLVTLLPTFVFCLSSVFYAFLKLKKNTLALIRGTYESKIKIDKKDDGELHFLKEIRKSNLKSRKILVFFVGFSSFCFSSMTQMSMSMERLASKIFSLIIISIGLVLAFVTLLMSLAAVVKANSKDVAIMKAFGYSEKECSSSILGGYRPVSYIGFAIGSAYQYFLLRIMVDIVFADIENMPEYGFDFKAFTVSLMSFIIIYELIIYIYSKRLCERSLKEIMLE